MPRPAPSSTAARSVPTPQSAAPAPRSQDNTPVHAIRHRNLKASIWRNDTAKGPMYKVTAVRSYREGNEWRDTHSFAFDELMNVAKLLADAHTWIAAQLAQENAAEPDEPSS